MSEITTSEEQRWAEYVRECPWLSPLASWDDLLSSDSVSEGKLFVQYLMKQSKHNWTDEDRQKINGLLDEFPRAGDNIQAVYETLGLCFKTGVRDKDFAGVLFMMDCLVVLIKRCNDAIQERAAGMGGKGDTIT